MPKQKNDPNSTDREVPYTPSSISIKSWKEDDRPREKLLLKGKRALSNAELLAIIIGSGSRDESAVTLAKKILASVEHQWDALAKLSVDQLCQFKGIGEAKAISIITALEIGNRRLAQPQSEKSKMTSSANAYESFYSVLRDLIHEEFWVLFLNRANEEIKKSQIGVGGFTATMVDVRVILKQALECNATALILAHNHPSGNLTPSTADRELTQSIKEAADLMNISVLDHLIVSNHGYYSFADHGEL